MPQVTVYVREDDLEQWKAIEKKSEFIHDSLILAKLPDEVVNPRKPDINRIAKEMDKETKPIYITVEKPKIEVAKEALKTAEKKVEVAPYKFPPSAASMSGNHEDLGL